MPNSFDPYHVWLGIPPDEQPPHHYRLLGVRAFESNADVIANALDQRIAHLRTLQIGKRGADSQRLLNEVTAAGVCLLDKRKREKYDEGLRSAEAKPAANAFAAAPPASGSPLPVVPLAGDPPAGAIPMPLAPQPIPVVLEPAPAAAFAPVVAASVSGPPAAHRRAQSWLPLALAGSSAAALLLTVAIVGWWRWGPAPAEPGPIAQVPAETGAPRGQLPGNSLPSSSLPSANPPGAPGPQTNAAAPRPPRVVKKTTAANKSQPSPRQAEIDALIADYQARKKAKSGAGGRAGNPPPAGLSNSSPATTTSASAHPTPDASQQVAWISNRAPQLAFHRVAGRWIEFHTSAEYWFDEVRASTPEWMELYDPRRGLNVRLYADRVELKSAQQDWAVWARGRWCAAKELPPMARREPTQPTLYRDIYPVNAMAFGGGGKVEIAVPQEIKGAADDFTIDMWIRWNRYFPGRELLSLDGERFLLTTHRIFPDSGQTDIVFKLPLFSDRWHASVPAERWTHLALVRSGGVMRLFVNGKPVQEEALPADFALNGSYLVLGSKSVGPCAVVRDFRISRTALYREPFTPPLKLERNPQALALLDLRGPVNPQGIRNEVPGGTGAYATGIQWLRLTSEFQVAGEKSDGSLDLMQAFNSAVGQASNHSIATTRRNISTTRETGITGLSIPICPPAEYEISAKIQRQSGNGGAFLGLSIAGRPAVLAIDAFPVAGAPAVPAAGAPAVGNSKRKVARAPNPVAAVETRRTGLLLGNLGAAASTPGLHTTASLLPRGRQIAVKVKVGLVGMDRYNVAVSFDGGQPLSFGGQLAALSIPPEFEQPGFTSLSFGSIDARMEFTEVMLRPVADSLPRELLTGMAERFAERTSAAAKAAPPEGVSSLADAAGTAGAAPPAAVSLPPQPARVPEPSAGAAARLPVPSTDEMAARLAVAREIYEADLKQAATPQAKSDLAREIRRTAATTTSDDAARYVLYDLARKIALQAADVDGALSVASQIDREFEVPPRQVTLATMKGLGEGTLALDQRTKLAAAAEELAADLLAEREFAVAREAIEISVQAAASLRDAALRRTILQRRDRIDSIVDRFAAIEADLRTLASDPSDPAANLAAGKFWCLDLEDWPRGLPQLALTGESPFAQPARIDLESRGVAAQEADAAEAWLQLADSPHVASPSHKAALKARARLLYTHAKDGLSGLDRVRAEKRLEALQEP